MSHQTGITASEELKDFFAKSKSGSVRLIKVAIKNEQLVLDQSEPPKRTWEEDWDGLVIRCIEHKQPCYILYRLDSKSETGYDWVYISYSPDNSPVKQKMLYAATRATLKMEFGSGQIKEEMFGTTKEEMKLEGFKKHITLQDNPAPLTYAEEELERIKKNEIRQDISINTKQQTVQGVAFPMDRDAYDKLIELKEGTVNYVQLSLDLQEERINLESAGDFTVDLLASRIPTQHARYIFYRFDHSHEGDYMQSFVFIYSMPANTCTIRERMLYSSCKAPLLDAAEQQIGLEFSRKLEVDTPEEVTEELLYDEIHPKKNIARQQFARPKGPAGRGPKRITKPNPTKPAE